MLTKRVLIYAILLLASFLLVLSTSCEKDDDEPASPVENGEGNEMNYYNVKVLGLGLDCGDSYLIEFDDDAEGLPESNWGNIFYEINLPDKYKVEGKKIEIKFREPKGDEFMGCTMLGPTYRQIFIIKVK